MRQLTFVTPGRLEWQEHEAPRLQGDEDALVRPLVVARCDLDLYIARGVVPFRGPFAFGHETIAEVVDAGPAVRFKPGDRVVVPFQLSCGDCTNCRRGLTNSCEAFPFGAAYGLKPTSGTEFGGAFSDLLRVPFANHMLMALPRGVDPVAAASVADNIADGWRAVAKPLAERPGASVLVVGGLAQSVGLYAAGCAIALGAGRVLYLDDDGERLTRARALGADTGPLALGDGRTASEQFDIVVEAAGDERALQFAVLSCAANGVVTVVSIHFSPLTAIPLTRAYYKGFTLHTSRVSSRSVLPHVLDCIACGSLSPGKVTHRILPFEEAADAMTDAGPKLVFTRGG
jgi:threonine dehydrogenase-like Zn-dependent dehydrogenase